VDKLSLGAQAKLLRFLQEKEICRLGSGVPLRSDVRIIAASGNNLAADLNTGTFRSDLYFRLRGAVVSIPPLRERPEDIKVLAEHFLAKHKKPDTMTPMLDPAAADMLLSHHWPGNARELENVIRAALLVAQDGLVLPCHIEVTSTLNLKPFRPLRSAVRDAVDAVTTTQILRALSHSGGSRHEAADTLGISPRTLSRLILKLKIDCPGHRRQHTS
jgi:transcriptional regulator with PAS, ATPase and Fis domain